MPERVVRFTEQFFNRLDWLLPEEREADGTPSITDFLLHELPRVRDRLASDFHGHTLATDDADVRVWIGSGILVHRFVLYVALAAQDVEVFWVTIEHTDRDHLEPDSPWD